MDEKEVMLGSLYSYLADELNISRTMQEKAVRSYEAVGEYLGDGLAEWDVGIFPQGSMNLGTVVRPLTDEDSDYDIDLVCVLKNGRWLPAEEIKQLVGNRLHENKMYEGKLDSEGKRCWTLHYDGFHMDILPCVPVDSCYSLQTRNTEIRLTHKRGIHDYVDKYSNPAEYKIWFEQRMQDILTKYKRNFAMDAKMEIEQVPTYALRTPLQKVIQLLKRHRDIYFQGKENPPVSIIITTLAAQAYRGEENVFQALRSVLSSMESYIERCGSNYWRIPNPVMIKENFADKWNEDEDKAGAFFEWRKQAEVDFILGPLHMTEGMDNLCRGLSRTMGERVVGRAFGKFADATVNKRKNGMLFAAGTAGGITTAGNACPVKAHNFYGN